MVASRQLLYRSAFWEIARPRHPLTAGHVLIRLSDPSTVFAHPSAADWLFCHGLARAALAEVLGATRCTIMFAHQWHPLGSAIGEPVAESSTPTFHLFGRWDGETTTPGHQLSLPAHRRTGEADHDMEATDAAMRESLRLARPETAAGPDAEAAAAVEPVPGPLVRAVDAGPRHTVLEPVRKLAAISEVRPAELLAIGAALAVLPVPGGFSGISCVALEGEEPGALLRVHALGRSAAEVVNPLEDFLDSPEVSLALL
ncbi:diadenosine tetraphosphate (Ap4A) HIT family hydrolase [Arthrobacter bambusae]|uniref:Diadenosine tetraphosphate (Ap4A) HIT family hydrolase n=1 Tax=Arthrobacter bambusae TaxID=1338426 RepID=A0ABV2P7Z6_9MICC